MSRIDDSNDGRRRLTGAAVEAQDRGHFVMNQAVATRRLASPSLAARLSLRLSLLVLLLLGILPGGLVI